MRIGELAKVTGVSERSLRHYEKKGILKATRLPNGYREYAKDSAMIVSRITCMLDSGLTTKTIAEILPWILQDTKSAERSDAVRAVIQREAIRLEHEILKLRRSRNLLVSSLQQEGN